SPRGAKVRQIDQDPAHPPTLPTRTRLDQACACGPRPTLVEAGAQIRLCLTRVTRQSEGPASVSPSTSEKQHIAACESAEVSPKQLRAHQLSSTLAYRVFTACHLARHALHFMP